MIKWTFEDMAARNAQGVTFADVIAGAECIVQSTGSVFRAVRSGTGATVWAGVCTEQGEWDPTYADLVGLKSVAPDAPYTLYGDYEKCGNMITGHLYWGVTTDGVTPGREFTVTPPVSPGSDFADAAFAQGTWEREIAGYSSAFAIADRLFIMYLTTATADLDCYGYMHVRYPLNEG
jgi:hypothetical protein